MNDLLQKQLKRELERVLSLLYQDYSMLKVAGIEESIKLKEASKLVEEVYNLVSEL